MSSLLTSISAPPYIHVFGIDVWSTKNYLIIILLHISVLHVERTPIKLWRNSN